MAGEKQARQESDELHVQGQIAQLPGRPDRTVLDDSIPLFFIGRNQNGFWVARESRRTRRRSFSAQTVSGSICSQKELIARLCHHAR